MVVCLVCQCNHTLNLLSRSEYFRLETTIADDQLVLNNLFTPPFSLTLIRSRPPVPTLTFSMVKGPVDLLSIQISNQTTEFNAYVTIEQGNNLPETTLGPLKSTDGLIKQCLLRVTAIKLELYDLPISSAKQNLQINLTTCQHTLRKDPSYPLFLTIHRFAFLLACNCTPLYDIMQDASYLDRIEVSDASQQLASLHEMIVRNNQTGFQFNSSTSLRFFRIYFKYTIPIARVELLTPRSNVKQIRLSYFDDYNQTIRNPNLQNWQVKHISDYGRVNNTLDKLCPSFPFRGIQVDILPTDWSATVATNATIKVFVRPCKGPCKNPLPLQRISVFAKLCFLFKLYVKREIFSPEPMWINTNL